MKGLNVKQRGRLLGLSLKAEDACRLMEEMQSELNELQDEVDDPDIEEVCEDMDDAVKYANDMADKLRTLRRQTAPKV